MEIKAPPIIVEPKNNPLLEIAALLFEQEAKGSRAVKEEFLAMVGRYQYRMGDPPRAALCGRDAFASLSLAYASMYGAGNTLPFLAEGISVVPSAQVFYDDGRTYEMPPRQVMVGGERLEAGLAIVPKPRARMYEA